MASGTKTGKDLENKNGDVTKLIEWATEDVNTIEEMERLFESSGVAYTSGEELTGDYKVVTGDEKQMFLKRIQGRKVFVVRWQFNTRDNKEFVSAYILVDGHGKFIINDGAKGGLYGQLSEVYSRRLSSGVDESHACAGLKSDRGFSPNQPFYYDTRTNKAIKKQDLEDVPDEYKRLSHPTWKLVF